MVAIGCSLGGGNKRNEREVFFERGFRKTVFERKGLKDGTGNGFWVAYVRFAWLARLV